MKFVDECIVTVRAGDGGNGCVAFRREKFVPRGGPSGGDGGRGGNVCLVGDEGLSTLLDLAYAHTLSAERGEHGQGKDRYGRAGADRRVRVPVGTRVLDADSGELLGEVLGHEQELIVARGGRGGWGNIHFATPFDRAPRRAEPGEPGETRRIRLELVVLADVGLLGFPNVGKSTLIRSVSRARPKVADYPFTTLHPHLGIVSVGEAHDAMRFAIADIPGLIPGASQGAGLGIRFLKHLERTRVLLHLVTIEHDEKRDPLQDYWALRKELESFDPVLASRPEIVALSKTDLPYVSDAYAELQERFAHEGITLHKLSAATGEGVRDMMQRLAQMVVQAKAEPQEQDARELDD